MAVKSEAEHLAGTAHFYKQEARSAEIQVAAAEIAFFGLTVATAALALGGELKYAVISGAGAVVARIASKSDRELGVDAIQRYTEAEDALYALADAETGEVEESIDE